MVLGQWWRICSLTLVTTPWQTVPFCGHCFQIVCQTLGYNMSRTGQTKTKKKACFRGDGGNFFTCRPQCECPQEQCWKPNQHQENFPSIMSLPCLSHLFKCLHLHSAKFYLSVVSWGTIIQKLALQIYANCDETNWGCGSTWDCALSSCVGFLLSVPRA